MLGNKDIGAVLAVDDMEAATKFYEGTLGLTRMEMTNPGEGAVLYKSGNAVVLVYQSQFAGTNQATAASWAVGDNLEAIIEELKAKGVSFEHYDMPGVTREGDVHGMGGGLKGAWFKDPAGNILNLSNQ